MTTLQWWMWFLIYCSLDPRGMVLKVIPRCTCSLNATKSDCCAGRSHDAKQINSDYAQCDKWKGSAPKWGVLLTIDHNLWVLLVLDARVEWKPALFHSINKILCSCMLHKGRWLPSQMSGFPDHMNNLYTLMITFVIGTRQEVRILHVFFVWLSTWTSLLLVSTYKFSGLLYIVMKTHFSFSRSLHIHAQHGNICFMLLSTSKTPT